MKIFIDTNIFVRLLTHDVPQKVKECERLFEFIQNGSIKPYISNVVIMELVYILTKQYRFNKAVVTKALEKIFKLRNITIIESTKTQEALVLFKKYSIKYGDCLIATQVPKGVGLLSYDTDFPKILAIKSITPAEIFNSDTIN